MKTKSIYYEPEPGTEGLTDPTHHLQAALEAVTATARKLKEERDEAREALALATDQAVQAQCKTREALRERDEARDDAAHWKIEFEIVVSRLCGNKHPRDNGVIFEHEIIPKLTRERDEAREAIVEWWKKWKCALELAAQAEVGRDEARADLAEEIKFHHRTHSELVQTQCQMQDVIRERDEARDEVIRLQEIISQCLDCTQILSAAKEATK